MIHSKLTLNEQCKNSEGRSGLKMESNTSTHEALFRSRNGSTMLYQTVRLVEAWT
jgi:hypothetical protein